jgi:putative acetyltransferase
MECRYVSTFGLSMIIIKRTNSRNKDFQSLVIELDADLAIRDGDVMHAFYAQFNGIDLLNQVVVAYKDDKAAGCGAFKPFDDKTAEIKRMYTIPLMRGKGIASSILDSLEKWAMELGFERTVLETGIRQPEAIALYRRKGYVPISNYGQYEGLEDSLCFEKQLK